MHVECVIADLPADMLACTDFATITIGAGLLQSERRSALTHELIHLERGPVATPFRDREEREVEAETARRLIPLDALADALLWSSNEPELAEEMWVAEEVVRTRLAGLTVDEKAYIEAEIGRKEESA